LKKNNSLKPSELTVESGIPVPGVQPYWHEAMATVFRIFLIHEDKIYGAQAAHAAFIEVDHLEEELSRFRETSDIRRINVKAASGPVKVGLCTLECLEHARRLWDLTGGVFDITIGSLIRCWIDNEKKPRTPSSEELHAAMSVTGMSHVHLDADELTVELDRDGVQIDLGGIGKGFAVDKMALILQEWGIEKALISGGGSSVLPVGIPDGLPGWPATLRNPREPYELLEQFDLSGESMSGSGLLKGPHILDPRTGQPVSRWIAAWAFAPDAVTADALSTAFMIMSQDEIESCCRRGIGIRGIVLKSSEEKQKTPPRICFGFSAEK